MKTLLKKKFAYTVKKTYFKRALVFLKIGLTNFFIESIINNLELKS